MDLRRIFGNKAEDLTAKYLQNKGLKIIAKQYRSRFGEIDLIALDGSEVVFVEVKARKTSDFGFPEESVTASKIEKIIAVGDKFLKEKNWLLKPWRIDVVAITFGKTELEFNHIEGVGE
ncbi:YraN family protein [Candidatus Parcubacteria bacterium]|uniref:UPF0102 protein CO173_00725 n=1 Tax=Candidatus Uhrbacteria bacterium CG_4_9_14_3_um_filter_41_35 TaxID=1975034 RepID=A0A2M7XGA5_9BACT|nr:YraN family protein [Candidatus Parcubacteria bacterium]PIZ53519.1 MAG: YraN family protein [Candidatus Uhrbacteria bacterium CG_4_10_14_0_2_um_filter_41_7]PJA46901.1 MAG: YraN family protein [Candidatus Uhrbacteria bacterium CG_4_9_14_3_um_filter_41_35]